MLFADVARSMDIAAALELERLRDIMTDLVERSAAVARRYGGSVEYNGDGIMALFGAPTALEDHAVRACMAALDIQDEARRLAAVVNEHDELDLRVRVGLNSGRVIAGMLGSGALGYAATGETVGFAQRMESVAPPGEVMLSQTTARLVEHQAVLAAAAPVMVKGFDAPVCGFRLVSIRARGTRPDRVEASLVGRRWELAALEAMVDRATERRGGVVSVMGPPGIGKSRVAREAAALAALRGVEVVWTFCESHARDVPFHLVTQLLRAVIGVTDLDDSCARARLRDRLPAAGAQDLLLLDELLGIADPEVPLPVIDPDARRRRLTAMINTASLARMTPELVVIEDSHWIDVVSESMVSEFLSVVPRTPLMVLITARPEYRGELSRVSGAQSIALAPLSDSDTTALLTELLGSDSSVDEVTAIIAERSQGNPFFAEEMVRELVQRGALHGEPGSYVCDAAIAELDVPVTVQAALESRIDRLSVSAKRTVTAASVVGNRFGEDLLAALGADPEFGELIDAELIEQVRFTPVAEYAFRHPLVRAVAYESQLKSDRAESHRRLAAAIAQRAPESLDDNAAQIAEHLYSAGDLRAAYDWHMRAGASSGNRDVAAARVSWERACRIADELPDDATDVLAARIAPRTMLCASGWQAIEESRGRIDELRTLCARAGDQVSLAIGMSGLATELMYSGRSVEGSRLMSEQMQSMASLGDPSVIALGMIAFNNWFDAGEFDEILRWSETVIELTEHDPNAGAGMGFGSPLAAALAWHGVAAWWRGLPGWREDLSRAWTIAQKSDPTTSAMVVGWTFGLEIAFGVLRANDAALRTIEEAVQTAEGSSNPALSIATWTLAVALLDSESADARRRGLELMARVRDMWVQEPIEFLIPVADFCSAAQRCRQGERAAVLPVIRDAVANLHRAGRPFFGVLGIRALVETLAYDGDEADLAEAQQAIEFLSSWLGDTGSAVVTMTELRLRALLARCRGDDPAYHVLTERYRAMTRALDFD
ncbi:cyclase [Mycolicibacterium aichiense]|uniref:Cyclase n=1 Tax=Mycolicibacterium aichiense TaxID=1799 RepID=A0AAD1HLP0_9MYCO|nr:adenylate/guanylate cyclase domain-containing protein [Mycolicibacterium aichiense]BBX06456.1 cyclase [Mycolicibacterium aichiense]STZ24208.1 adenylate/guanylate cyclase family protein [Mycolicibacterium aichiense]